MRTSPGASVRLVPSHGGTGIGGLLGCGMGKSRRVRLGETIGQVSPVVQPPYPVRGVCPVGVRSCPWKKKPSFQKPGKSASVPFPGGWRNFPLHRTVSALLIELEAQIGGGVRGTCPPREIGWIFGSRTGDRPPPEVSVEDPPSDATAQGDFSAGRWFQKVNASRKARVTEFSC